MSFRNTFVAFLSSVATLAASSAFAQSQQPLRIALSASPVAESVHYVAKKAKEQGLDVKVIEFTDWVTPNSALANKDVDVNFFQHVPFLENAKRANNWPFTAVSPGYITWLGAYSDKLKSIDQLPEGATVSIANDPVNTGRALLFLQSLNLVKLKEGVDFRATLQDIVANPKKLKIIQVEAQQVVRSLPDVHLGLTFPSFIRLAGREPTSAIVFEKPSKQYAIHWVTRTENANDPRLAKFVQLYNSDPEVKALLTRLYAGQIGFAW
ncbi:MAG: MetQ/NlpA family ABC transporter substrate-binding protein [Rhizobacter sp.]